MGIRSPRSPFSKTNLQPLLDYRGIPDLAFWYDGSDLGTVYTDNTKGTPATNGVGIGYQLDKSGRGRHRSVTASTKPTCQTNIINGRAVVRFNKDDDTSYFDGFDVAVPPTTPYTWFGVVIIPGNITIERHFMGASTGNGCYTPYVNTSQQFAVNTEGVAVLVTGATALAINTVYVLCATFDPTLATNQAKVYVNGVLDGQGTNTSAVNAAIQRGGADHIPHGEKADEGESLLISRAVSGLELNMIHHLAFSRWLPTSL